MTEKKDRDRVMAEITLSHVLRLATEQDAPESREQALAFINQAGHAYEMWKHMMQAAEDFIGCSLLRGSISALSRCFLTQSQIRPWCHARMGHLPRCGHDARRLAFRCYSAISVVKPLARQMQ